MKEISGNEEPIRSRGKGPHDMHKNKGNRAAFVYALLLLGILVVAGTALFVIRKNAQRTGMDMVSVFGAEADQITARVGENIVMAGSGITMAGGDASAFGMAGEAALAIVAADMKNSEIVVDSCLILPDGEQFALTAATGIIPESDDGYFYLFGLEVYEEAIPEGEAYIAKTKKANSFTLTADVKEFQEDSRLYQKFVVGVLREGKYEQLTAPVYMSNPEVLADYDEAFPETDSIKGLLVDPQNLGTTELEELGVHHAVYNIPVARLLGPSTSDGYPTITYTHNGKDYIFNGHVVSEYDYVFSTLTRKGIVITAILLNNKSDDHMYMIHPLSRDKNANYYAFNAAEEKGAETLEAICAFLAERYEDQEHGVVMNWIIGNEINVRSQWNYMQPIDIQTYTREYVRAFRICYNAIKSMNANARVYISVDQQWNMKLTSNSSYNARDLLDEFNRQISREGNIGWGLAHHPYSVPITWPKFWDLSPGNKELVQDSVDSPVVIIYNIHVATDYMQREEFLAPNGEVRPFLLSETGFTSAYGEEVQAAAFAYAYFISESNPYIDALILSRETDAVEEVSQGLALGLSYQNGRKKLVYDVFKYIDTDKSEEYTEFAKKYIGIEDWDEVIEER